MRIIDYSACGDPTDWLEKLNKEIGALLNSWLRSSGRVVSILCWGRERCIY